MSFPRLFPNLIFPLIFCLAGCFAAFGQYHFDSWTTDDGLPQNGIRDITQTQDGYLWFTTFDGLVRFDGIQFTTFGKSNTKGIINNRFTSLYSDVDGTLYASTMDDGVLTIYKDGVFSSFPSDVVPGRYIKSIRPDGNGVPRFLAENEDGTSETWYYLRDGKFVFSEAINKSRSEIEFRGKSGTLWTITRDKIIEERGEIKNIYQFQIKDFEFLGEMFEDGTGALWIGGSGLVRLRNEKIDIFGDLDVFPAVTDFHSFWEESDGSIWFASGGKTASGVGLVRFYNGNFSVFGKEEGLSETSIYSVFRGREGSVWLATNKGINRLRKNVISTFGVENGLNHSEVYPLYRDSKGDIWIGTVSGLNVYRDGKFSEVNLKQAQQNAPEHTRWKNGQVSVQSIFEDSNGKMWIGVAGVLYIVQNGVAEALTETEGFHVYSILEDKFGIVWAASNKGILKFDQYKLTTIYTTENGLPNDFVSVVFEDSRGRLWFGGLGGLSQFSNGKFTNYTVENGLTGNYIRTIYEDADGVLWIGTYDEGLSRFKDGQFVNYNAEIGLFNNGVFAIEEDNRGYFWISSNQGIYRVKRQELNDFAEKKISKINSVGYGKEDGMLNSECNGGRQPASVKDENGKFWFPTQDGVVIVDPDIETQNPLPPSVVIESATVERDMIDIRNGLVIEPGQKNIEIKYTGISLIKSDQVKFRYKLEGHDVDWIDAGSRRSAYYSYLPPGSYTFRVIAANSDGVWNETGASLNVQLKPFFYQTGLFYLIIFLAVVVVLFVIWKFSVYRLQLRERLLKKLVAERTKELQTANENLAHLANSDSLTGVANRRRFEEFLHAEWSRASRSHNEISMILVDIDHFKLFNDTYGHQAGDECLKMVAHALLETINRPSDLVARFGGEEFAIILGVTDDEGTTNIAEQARENVRKLRIRHSSSATGEFLTISLGVATTLPTSEMTEYDLINAADKALYQAKANGRNQVAVFDFSSHSVPIKTFESHLELR